jgi:hypothetical protein
MSAEPLLPAVPNESRADRFSTHLIFHVVPQHQYFYVSRKIGRRSLQRRISHVRQTLTAKEWGEPAESGAISELEQVSVAVLV